MKKVLLGTTAIIGASFLSGQAFAADPIQLDVGGGATWGFGGLLGDSGPIGGSDQRSTFIEQSVEVQFTGSTNLDNGLTVGVRVEYESNGGTARDDENYVFVSGGFGQFRIGDDDDAADHLNAKGAPCAGIFCADNGTFGLSTSTANGFDDLTIDVTDTAEVSGDAAKIVYMTPRLAGFRLVATYAPDADEGPRDSTGGGFNRNNATNDIFGVGADFGGDLGPVNLRVAAALTSANVVGAGVEDILGTYAGTRVGFAGFTVGGGYGYQWAANDVQQWSVGATYGAGPVTVGVQHAKENVYAAGSGGNSTYKRGVWSLDGTYTMGPGISVSAGLNYHDTDTQAGLNGENDYDAIGIGMGIGVGF